MFTHSTTKISNEHVNHIVSTILNKKKRNIIEQQQTFIRRNTDENNKRNNYLLDKFTMKKRTK
jgi:predicted nucleic-acid-binding protein